MPLMLNVAIVGGGISRYVPPRPPRGDVSDELFDAAGQHIVARRPLRSEDEGDGPRTVR